MASYAVLVNRYHNAFTPGVRSDVYIRLCTGSSLRYFQCMSGASNTCEQYVANKLKSKLQNEGYRGMRKDRT